MPYSKNLRSKANSKLFFFTCRGAASEFKKLADATTAAEFYTIDNGYPCEAFECAVCKKYHMRESEAVRDDIPEEDRWTPGRHRAYRAARRAEAEAAQAAREAEEERKREEKRRAAAPAKITKYTLHAGVTRLKVERPERPCRKVKSNPDEHRAAREATQRKEMEEFVTRFAQAKVGAATVTPAEITPTLPDTAPTVTAEAPLPAPAAPVPTPTVKAKRVRGRDIKVLRNQRRDAGLCPICGGEVVPGRSKCAVHLAYYTEKATNWYASLSPEEKRTRNAAVSVRTQARRKKVREFLAEHGWPAATAVSAA